MHLWAEIDLIKAIYDCMQLIPSPIETWCVGRAASMGSLLLTAGSPGCRYALPNAEIMIHQPLGGAQGQASDIIIQVFYSLFLERKQMDRKTSGRTYQKNERAINSSLRYT